jgi:hypothetical protein
VLHLLRIAAFAFTQGSEDSEDAMDALDKIIAERRDEVSSLQLRMVALTAELAALELAARLRPGASSRVHPSRPAISALEKPAAGGRRPGDISHTWRGVLKGVYDLDMPVNHEMVAEIAKERGIIVAAASVRDRVRNFIKNGLMIGTNDGFTVTQDAVERFGFTKENAANKGAADEKVGRVGTATDFQPPSSPVPEQD